MSGFVYSQILLACEELDWLQALAIRPEREAELARLGALTDERARLLVDAAVAVGLLVRQGDLVRLSLTGQVIAHEPGLRALVRHHRMFYRDLSDPVGLLQASSPQTEMREFWSYVETRGRGGDHGVDPRAARYSELMTMTQSLVVSQVRAAVPLTGTRALLDLGGGQGRLVSELLAEHPGLRGAVFDLPGVVASAKTRAEGLQDRSTGRLEWFSGDFFADPYPDGFDMVSLVRVLYDHPDDWVLRLLTRVCDYLRPLQGRLIVAEPMASQDPRDRMGAAYFGFYLLAMQGGRPRTAAELTNLLRQAGFRQVVARPTPLPVQCSVLEARL